MYFRKLRFLTPSAITGANSDSKEESVIKTLYPAISPYHQFMLLVTEPHEIYIEECGNPNGIPVLFIHGGPGAGCGEDDRCFFDPELYRIILFDQRGCGRSTPYGFIENNTTQDLVGDIEAIRVKLGIKQWVVFGGSWGSTLSLAYSQMHTQRVHGLILRGIFFASKPEADWIWQEGMSEFYPEEFARYQSLISEDNADDLATAFYNLMMGDDEQLKEKAALEFMRWEATAIALTPDKSTLSDSKLSVAQGLIEAHYFANHCFLQPQQIENDLAKLRQLPVYIVNGRYDMLTKPSMAWKLHQGLPGSKLSIVPGAGHSSKEPGTIDRLVAATDEMAERLLDLQ